MYLSNFFAEIENNDLDFNKFIKNYKTNSHKFSQDVIKDLNYIGDFLYGYHTDKYIIKQTFKKI